MVNTCMALVELLKISLDLRWPSRLALWTGPVSSFGHKVVNLVSFHQPIIQLCQALRRKLEHHLTQVMDLLKGMVDWGKHMILELDC